MHLRVRCMIVLLMITTISYSQHQTYPHTLLWRISGKGLTHPSYLYGTIHLSNKSLFRFGDSVYNAIERSAGLAIEVSPDEMVAYWINKAFDLAQGKKLSEILKAKDYKKYSPLLEKKFNKPASQINAGDIIKEKNKWVSDFLEKGEMSTFMDAYLYNIARRRGKWVGGVEDLADQSGLVDDLIDKSDIDNLLAEDSIASIQSDSYRAKFRLIGLYLDQNINGIDSMANEEAPELKDALIIKRNVKMARRIDSLTALRTMFIAIGAAHLAGDSGVIHLLQQRGFRVEPVFSSKKINADNYIVKEVHQPWTKVEDAHGFYTVSMPGNPANIKLYGLIDVKCFFDIFNLSGYITMALPSSGSASGTDSAFNRLTRQMFGATVPVTKKVFSNGVEGKEFTHQVTGGNMRIQVFFSDNALYLVYIYKRKKQDLINAEANSFFSSFVINKTRPVTAGSYTFTDSVMGISFISPANLTYNSTLSSDKEEAWHISSFTGADLANGSYVMLFSKDVKPAHFISSDSVIFSEARALLKRQYINVEIEPIDDPGYEGLRFSGRDASQPHIYTRGVCLMKYNRNIILLVLGDSARLQLPEIQNVFRSFHFIAPPVVRWGVRSTIDGTASAWVPAEFRQFNEGKSHFAYAFDSTTASCYYIFSDSIDRYIWYKNDSSFWNGRLPFYEPTYKREKISDITTAGLHGKELLLKKGAIYKRARVLLHGKELYETMVSGDKNVVFNDNATAFFNSFKVNTPLTSDNFLTEPKTAILLNDLSDKDTSVRKQAFEYLNKAPFDKNDIPLLYQASLIQYLDPHKQEPSDAINTRLTAIINKLKKAGK